MRRKKRRRGRRKDSSDPEKNLLRLFSARFSFGKGASYIELDVSKIFPPNPARGLKQAQPGIRLRDLQMMYDTQRKKPGVVGGS